MLTFTAALYRPEGIGTSTFITAPFSVEQEFGTRAQVKVKGTVNGVPFRSSLMPYGNGTHYMAINQALREAAGISAGDEADFTLELDTEARVVEVPEDVNAALQENAAAGESFERMSYSHRKEYVEWINSAKKPETRTSRIAKAMVMLAEGKRLKG
jgi:hypothetical protein